MNATRKAMPAAASTSLTVPAKVDALSQCTEFVIAHAVEAGFTPSRLCELELVVEEVVTNICRHGYDDQLGQLELRCRRVGTQRLLLEFIDGGRPFDIIAAPPPDLTADLEQREVGGLGVPLIRAMADEVSYRREGNRNILRLIVRAER
ncbi:MAG TPA: ATP-binding protein [Candidatus Binatia bacterium]|jgi:anti-sigma regulatory factor (Ser/Thr protein kinase)